MNFKLEDYMKPGISRNAKNQITYNNFVHTEAKKFQIKEIENENRKKAEKKVLEIKKIVDSKNEKPKQVDTVAKKTEKSSLNDNDPK